MDIAVGHESGPGEEPVQTLNQHIKGVGAQIRQQEQGDAQMGDGQTHQQQDDPLDPNSYLRHCRASSSRRFRNPVYHTISCVILSIPIYRVGPFSCIFAKNDGMELTILPEPFFRALYSS